MNTCEKINKIKEDIIKLLDNKNITNQDYINYYNKYNIKFDNASNTCSVGTANIGVNFADNSACANEARKYCDKLFPDMEKAINCTEIMVGDIGEINQTNTSSVVTACSMNVFKTNLQNENNHTIALSLYETKKNLNCSDKNINTTLNNTASINKINKCIITNNSLQQNIFTKCKAQNINMSNVIDINSKCIFDEVPTNKDVKNNNPIEPSIIKKNIAIIPSELIKKNIPITFYQYIILYKYSIIICICIVIIFGIIIWYRYS